MSNGEYKWIHGYEFPVDAIERMKNSFRRPTIALEEMRNSVERESYTELIDKPVEEISVDYLSNVLYEISSGTFCFYQREDWQQWFKYLLPHLIVRSHEVYISELLLSPIVTAFMSIYWKGIPEDYLGFRDDIIDTLSLSLMNKKLWFIHKDSNSGISSTRAHFLDDYLDGRNNPRVNWDASDANGSLSSSMFFCIKYLNADEMGSWIKSLFEIDDLYWKGALSVWLLGALDLFGLPPTPKALDKSKPNLDWENSHVFIFSDDSDDNFEPEVLRRNKTKDFLPSENVKLFLEEIRKHLNDELLIEWAELFSNNSLVLESTYTVPECLMDILSNFEANAA